MNIFQRNLGVTLKRFGIQARWLARQTQSDESGLSKYLKGSRDTYSDTLSKWFDALPVEAQEFFLENCLQKKIVMREQSLSEIIDQLDPNNPLHRKQAADALRLIVSKFIPDDGNNNSQSKVRENTDELVEVR